MYTPIVTPYDLKSKMYPEVQQLISRGDESIVIETIAQAIMEVKMYLNKYDLVALFGSEANDVAASQPDVLIQSLVKTIAAWHLLCLANPNADLALANTKYEQAIKTLKDIQAGKANPDGWPYRDMTDFTAPNGDSVFSISNPRKPTHF
jgi:hypothetical protein